MKKNILRIITCIMAIMLVFAFCTTAFADTDPNPKKYWSHMPTVKSGKEGHHVRGLQQFLLMRGYAPGSVDGNCGSNTVAAIKRFQGVYDMTQDGIAGTNTWNKAYSFLATYELSGSTMYYVVHPVVTPWNNNYPQDRYQHRSGGSWWVQYGNTPTSWSSAVQMAA